MIVKRAINRFHRQTLMAFHFSLSLAQLIFHFSDAKLLAVTRLKTIFYIISKKKYIFFFLLFTHSHIGANENPESDWALAQYCRMFSLVRSWNRNRFSASVPLVTTWKFNAPICTRKLQTRQTNISNRMLTAALHRARIRFHLLRVHCDLFDSFHHIDFMEFSLHTILIVNVHRIRPILMLLVFGHLFGK